MVAVIKTKKLGLFNAFNFYKQFSKEDEKRIAKGIKQKGPLMIFHTVEFHIIILLGGIFINPLFYSILTGMLFHSLCDVLDLTRRDYLYHRQFLFIKSF